MPGIVTCVKCGKTFSRLSSLKRHKEQVCPDDTSEEESDTEPESEDEGEDAVEQTTDEESEVGEDDDDDDDVHDDYAAWDGLVEMTFEDLKQEYGQLVRHYHLDAGLKLEAAKEKAFEEMKTDYRKGLQEHYLQFLQNMKDMRADTTHQAIRQTAKRLRDDGRLR